MDFAWLTLSLDEALIRMRSLMDIDTPDNYDLKWIQGVVQSTEGLSDADKKVWGNNLVTPNGEIEPPGDIMALRCRPKEDTLTNVVTDVMLKWLNYRGRTSLEEPELYESQPIQWARAITGAIASTLSVVSIVVLHFVNSASAQIGLIAAFNLVSALLLAKLTDVRRAEIFAITAGYNAVCAVFIGSNVNASS